MARGRPGGWERRGKTERPPFPRPRREAGPGGPGRDPARDAEVLARLSRLESLVLAIAAHLGVEAEPGARHAVRAVRPAAERPDRPPSPAAGRPDRPRSPGAGAPGTGRPGASRPGSPEDAHAVVRTVARGLSGRLKQYNPERGYGFVVSAQGPDDVFFHRSDCRADPEALQPSAAVRFDLVEMANGQFKATNLDTP